jgi:hypothetical protein
MRIPLGGLRRLRPDARRRDPFTRAKHGDLDIVMPPPYDMTDHGQRQARQRVEEMIRELQPGGLDGNSRDVLNNLINAWMDQEIARVRGHRDEREAVGIMLTGLAREEIARRRQRYEADYARAQHDRQALAIAFRELTGAELADLGSPHPDHRPGGPLRSTLGPADLPGTPDDAAGPAGEPPDQHAGNAGGPAGKGLGATGMIRDFPPPPPAGSAGPTANGTDVGPGAADEPAEGA